MLLKQLEFREFRIEREGTDKDWNELLECCLESYPDLRGKALIDAVLNQEYNEGILLK